MEISRKLMSKSSPGLPSGWGKRTSYSSVNSTMCVCMVTHIARVWINRVRLPILLVVSRTGKMNISLSAFAPENLVSRDGCGSPVPRHPAHLHTQAISPEFCGSVHSVIQTAIRHGLSPELIRSRNCVQMAFTAERPPAQGQ